MMAIGNARPTVMVVEREPEMQELLQRYVAKSGHRPIRALSGEEALELAQRERPAAILLNVTLPGMTGWDVLRALKGDPVTHRIPVVIYSALDMQARSWAAGADGYLPMPVLYQDVLKTLARLGIGPGNGTLTPERSPHSSSSGA